MITEWLNMGGYAAFVWSSYGLAAAVLVYNLWSPWRRFKRLRAELNLDAASSNEKTA